MERSIRARPRPAARIGISGICMAMALGHSQVAQPVGRLECVARQRRDVVVRHVPVTRHALMCASWSPRSTQYDMGAG